MNFQNALNSIIVFKDDQGMRRVRAQARKSSSSMWSGRLWNVILLVVVDFDFDFGSLLVEVETFDGGTQTMSEEEEGDEYIYRRDSGFRL